MYHPKRFGGGVPLRRSAGSVGCRFGGVPLRRGSCRSALRYRKQPVPPAYLQEKRFSLKIFFFGINVMFTPGRFWSQMRSGKLGSILINIS